MSHPDTALHTGFLHVELSQASTNPLTLRVTLRNTHPSSALSVLPWDTPIDPRAALLGVFTVTDPTTKDVVTLPRIAIKRKLPDTSDVLVQIDPTAQVTHDVAVEGSLISLEKGKRYDVQAKGSWRAVWAMPAHDVRVEDLRKQGAADNAMTGTFESSPLNVLVE